MQTIKKEYEVYTFDELSQEAKDKAREDYNNQDYGGLTFLQDDLREYLHEELTERGYDHEEITPLYCLDCSQGSGLMFEGTVEDKKGNKYTIKQSGHYYHEKSTDITGVDKDDEVLDYEEVKKFEDNIYIPICKKVRDRGYDEIEYSQSEEVFEQNCEANDYLFLEDGTMFNN